jgi:hypothetical protein
MAFPDCGPDLGVANLAFVLQFVGGERRDDGDDAAGRIRRILERLAGRRPGAIL